MMNEKSENMFTAYFEKKKTFLSFYVPKVILYLR